MSSITDHARIAAWLTEPVAGDVAKSLLRLAEAEDVQHVAVMPDVHLAENVCIGTAVATRELIYPQAVGGDIGCGMAAWQFDVDADLLADERTAAELMQFLYHRVPSNRHRRETNPGLPVDLMDSPLSDKRLESEKVRDGRVQLGTLGRGNHFLEMLADEEGRLWCVVHSGSRGIGQAIARHHLQKATGKSRGLAYLSADSAAGQAYLSDADWAIRYARCNRLQMLQAVMEFLQDLCGSRVDAETRVDHHHNHVQTEEHGGEKWWIHRKGAQSARKGEIGILPGSMGTHTYLVHGCGDTASLRSCAHGAGRKLSRSEARQRVSSKQLVRQMGKVWFNHRNTQQLRDEAPSVYKDLDAVQRAQRSLCKVSRRLRPRFSYKGV